MSISPAACGELKPEICANLRLLIKVFVVVVETPTPPVNLTTTTKRKPLLLCVGARVFVFSQTPVFRIQTEAKNLASVTPLFDFHAEHNGEACIESLDPKDRGTERRFRFTRALLCTLLGVKSEDTITNHVDKLLKRGAIEVTKNLVTLKIPTNSGVLLMQESQSVHPDLEAF